MLTDWKKLANELGTLNSDGSESLRYERTEQALDEILGDEWIKHTVEHAVSFKAGKLLAMSCLRYLRSKKASLYAYEIYKASTGEIADQAVLLIKDIAHPVAVDWIEEFLNDENVISRGLGVLDQLLWQGQIPYDNRAKSLLNLAETKSNGMLTEHITFIKSHKEEKK